MVLVGFMAHTTTKEGDQGVQQIDWVDEHVVAGKI
jgi:hypothetical protein